jgi:hypothetical protein
MSEQFDIQGQVIVNTGDAEAALKKLRDKEAADNKAASAAQTAAMSKIWPRASGLWQRTPRLLRQPSWDLPQACETPGSILWPRWRTSML